MTFQAERLAAAAGYRNNGKLAPSSRAYCTVAPVAAVSAAVCLEMLNCVCVCKCVYANSGLQLRSSGEQLSSTQVCQPVARLRSVLAVEKCESQRCLLTLTQRGLLVSTELRQAARGTLKMLVKLLRCGDEQVIIVVLWILLTGKKGENSQEVDI